MSLSKVTIIGQEQFLQQNENKSLFDLLQLPDGIDKDLLVDNIFLESGDFESMYDNPYFMRNMIGVWGRKWYRTFAKWVAVLNIQYEPLENYDRKEFWEDQGKMNRKQTQDTTDNLSVTQGITDDFDVTQSTADTSQSVVNSTSDTTTTDTQASESNDTQTSSGTTHSKTESEGSRSVSTTTENLVSAYDASTYQPSDESIGSTSESTSDESTTDGSTSSSSTATTAVDLSGNGTNNNISHSQTDNTASEALNRSEDRQTDLTRSEARTIGDLLNENRGDNNEHRGRIHGNIGVKTTQSMLAEELEVQRFNIINEITDIFVTEFCVLVYD